MLMTTSALTFGAKAKTASKVAVPAKSRLRNASLWAQ
jgi:hypothetical protein